MNKIKKAGYVGLADDSRHVDDSVLEEEEEGNGRVVAEAMDEDTASYHLIILSRISSLTSMF